MGRARGNAAGEPATWTCVIALLLLAVVSVLVSRQGSSRPSRGSGRALVQYTGAACAAQWPDARWRRRAPRERA